MIYDAFKKNVINEFKIERDRRVAENNLKNNNYNLFQIDDNLELYNSIIGLFNIICLSNVSELVKKLCEKNNLDFETENPHMPFDCSITLDEKFYIEFLSKPNTSSSSIKHLAQN